MESNLQTREKLFKILKRFSNGTQTTQDCEELLSIIYYKTPYKNSIVFPSSKEDLKVSTVQMHDKSDRGRQSSLSGTPKIDIDISEMQGNDNDPANILQIFNTLGHEYTHVLQHKASIASAKGDVVPSKKLKEVLEDLESGLKSSDFMHELSSKMPKEFADEDFKERLEYLFYAQLQHEENARDCGFEFAKEMFLALTSDELCSEEIKEYLTTCKLQLDKEWEKEMQDRESKIYGITHDLAKDIATTIVDEDRDSLSGYSITLARMRKSSVNKQAYFEFMIKNNVTPSNIDRAYLEGEDLEKMLICGVMSKSLPLYKLFDPNLFDINITPQRIADACIYSIESNNSSWVLSLILYTINQKNGQEYLSPLKDKNIEALIIDKLDSMLKNFNPGVTTRQECEDFVCKEHILSLVSPENYIKFKKSCKQKVYNQILAKSREVKQEQE